MQIDDLMTVLVTPHCDGLILRQGQLSAEIPKPFLRFSPDWTLVRAAASVTLGSLPPFAASSSKVSFGPFASSDTGERIADFLLCISIA